MQLHGGKREWVVVTSVGEKDTWGPCGLRGCHIAKRDHAYLKYDYFSREVVNQSNHSMNSFKIMD